MMKREKLLTYLHRKLTGELDEQKQVKLADELRADDRKQVAEEVKAIWDWSGDYKKGYQPDTEIGLSRLQRRIQAAQDQSAPVKVRRLQRRRWLAIAAGLAMLIMAGLWWQRSGSSTDLQMVTVATEAGERLEVALPDGSTVVLNEHSRITYPLTFTGQAARAVVLFGEAYFSVQPDPQRSFCIQTTNTEVCVLGTAFNLRAYPEEEFTEVEVAEGKVVFRKRDGSQELVLQEHERGTIRHDEPKASQTEAVELNAHAWRTHELNFRKTPMSTVATTLERYFQIQLELDTALTDCRLNLNFQGETLADVLSSIASSLNAEIRQESDDVYQIAGGNCR